MAGNDFVQVQLTAAGVKLAGGIPLTVQNGRAHYKFEPGAAVRVLTSELRTWLSQQYNRDGEALFEVVPVVLLTIVQGQEV